MYSDTLPHSPTTFGANLPPCVWQLGAHWMTFGAKDNFVPIEESGLNPEHLLPVWTKEMMNRGKNATDEENDDISDLEKVNATAVGCPGDPTGRECLSGSDGVDGVHEISIFAPKKDFNSKKLEKQGVVVNDWAVPDPEKHDWNRAAEDHASGGDDKDQVDWTKLHTPQWSYENSAMKSQGWDPEGEDNKKLVLGRAYNFTGPVFGDKYSDGNEYKNQLQVSQTYRPRDDHFADWEPESEKNMKLVYGEGEIARSKVWNSKERKFVSDKWGVGDDQVPSADAAAELNTLGARTGEPFRDGLLRSWSGANGVGSSDHNLDASGVNATDPAPEESKLEKYGVNTAGW